MSWKAHNVYVIPEGVTFSEVHRNIEQILTMTRQYGFKADLRNAIRGYISHYVSQNPTQPPTESDFRFNYLPNQHNSRSTIEEYRNQHNSTVFLHYSPLRDTHYIRLALGADAVADVEELVKAGGFCFNESYDFYDSTDDLINEIGREAFEERRKTWRDITKYEQENVAGRFNAFNDYNKAPLSAVELEYEIVTGRGKETYLEVLKETVENTTRLVRQYTADLFMGELSKKDNRNLPFGLYVSLTTGDNIHPLIDDNIALFKGVVERVESLVPFVVDVSE